MAQERDTRSLVKDFNQQQAPPQYEQFGVHQPTMGYPQATYPPASYPAPAHQNMVVVTQPSMVTMMPGAPTPDPTCAILLSCCVFWCCCWPLGLAAFIVAMGASGTTGDKGKIRTSYILSIIGLSIGAVCFIVFIILYFTIIAVAESEMDDYDDFQYRTTTHSWW